MNLSANAASKASNLVQILLFFFFHSNRTSDWQPSIATLSRSGIFADLCGCSNDCAAGCSIFV